MALRRAIPRCPPAGVDQGAIDVGHDHIAATVNTLVLAYVGASLPVLLIFSLGGCSFGQAINTEAVAEQVVATLVGSIGLIAAVPITTVARRRDRRRATTRIARPLDTRTRARTLTPESGLRFSLDVCGAQMAHFRLDENETRYHQRDWRTDAGACQRGRGCRETTGCRLLLPARLRRAADRRQQRRRPQPDPRRRRTTRPGAEAIRRHLDPASRPCPLPGQRLPAGGREGDQLDPRARRSTSSAGSGSDRAATNRDDPYPTRTSGSTRTSTHRSPAKIGSALGRPRAAAAFTARLRALDAQYRAGLAHCKRRTIVTSHAAFGYLAARYKLSQLALEGISPEAEPSPQKRLPS